MNRRKIISHLCQKVKQKKIIIFSESDDFDDCGKIKRLNKGVKRKVIKVRIYPNKSQR